MGMIWLSGWRIPTGEEQGRKLEDQKVRAIIQTRGNHDLEHGGRGAEVVRSDQMLEVL